MTRSILHAVPAVLLFISICIFAAVPSYASDTSLFLRDGNWLTAIESEGFSADVENARDNAVNDALENAIHIAASTITGLDGALLPAEFEQFVDTAVADCIDSYQVISETREEDGVRVTLQADILINDLAREIINLHVPMNRPSVVVLVSETIDSEPTENSDAEEAIVRSLENAGFDVIDSSDVGRPWDVELPRELDVDFIIVGEASGDFIDYAAGQYNYSGLLEVQLVQEESGDVIAKMDFSRSGGGTTDTEAAINAIDAAAADASSYLIPQLLLLNNPAKLERIQLRIHGVDFADLPALEEDLSGHLGTIIDLSRVSYQSDTAQYEVSTIQTPQEFADNLAADPFPDFDVEVTEFRDNTIGIRILEPAPPQASSSRNEEMIDDGRIVLAVPRFNDPYGSGLASRAANDLISALRGFSYVRFVTSDSQADWILYGTITDVDFSWSYTPPVFDREDHHRMISEPSWWKVGYLSAEVRIVDTVTNRTLYDRSFTRSQSDYSRWRYGIRSDQAMVEDNWRSLLNVLHVDILNMLYGHFDMLNFVASANPTEPGRAVTPLTWRDGLYPELPMRLYVPAGSHPDLPAESETGWVELCKVTVKEVFDAYSVIELDDKWYEYFEFGEGNNLLLPVVPDRW
jgi:hypothetical protein